MKTLFRIQIQKADHSLFEKNIAAVSVIVAIQTALAAAGDGAEFRYANSLGPVDLEA